MKSAINEVIKMADLNFTAGKINNPKDIAFFMKDIEKVRSGLDIITTEATIRIMKMILDGKISGQERCMSVCEMAFRLAKIPDSEGKQKYSVKVSPIQYDGNTDRTRFDIWFEDLGVIHHFVLECDGSRVCDHKVFRSDDIVVDPMDAQRYTRLEMEE